MKKQVIEAGSWLAGERHRLAWSVTELLRRAEDMAHDFHWEGEMPTEEGIAALEAGALKAVPRWFKLLRYAIDRADHPKIESFAWLGERAYYWSRGPLKMSRPYLFEDEARFINSLDRLEDRHRRALRAFVTNFATRQCYDTKEAYARVLLEKFGVATSVLADEDGEFLERFQKLRPQHRVIVLDALRELDPEGEKG